MPPLRPWGNPDPLRPLLSRLLPHRGGHLPLGRLSHAAHGSLQPCDLLVAPPQLTPQQPLRRSVRTPGIRHLASQPVDFHLAEQAAPPLLDRVRPAPPLLLQDGNLESGQALHSAELRLPRLRKGCRRGRRADSL